MSNSINIDNFRSSPSLKTPPLIYYRFSKWERELVGIIVREEWFTFYRKDDGSQGTDLIAFREALLEDRSKLNIIPSQEKGG